VEESEKAKAIVSVMRRMVRDASTYHIHAVADLAKAEKGKELWEKDNSEDMGFSRCPYNVDIAQKRVDSTLKEKLAREEVLEYAIDVFLDKINKGKGE
jgi:hypothetical protein